MFLKEGKQRVAKLFHHMYALPTAAIASCSGRMHGTFVSDFKDPSMLPQSHLQHRVLSLGFSPSWRTAQLGLRAWQQGTYNTPELKHSPLESSSSVSTSIINIQQSTRRQLPPSTQLPKPSPTSIQECRQLGLHGRSLVVPLFLDLQDMQLKHHGLQRRSFGTSEDLSYKAKAPLPVLHPLPAVTYTESAEDLQAYRDARMLISRLQEAGFSAFIAGGWVRDRFLDRPPSDIDISTNAKVPELVKELGAQCVFQLHPNTARVSVGHNQFEVTTFKGCQREPDNFSAFLDAMSRDFTINSLLYNPITQDVLDYANIAKDIEKRNGSLSNLEEDPVRLLRGVRFAVQFQMTFEPQTLSHMQHCCSRLVKQDSLHLVLHTSQTMRGVATTEARAGRVWRELLKIASLENQQVEWLRWPGFKIASLEHQQWGFFSQALRSCQQIGLLDKLFPFLDNNVLASKAWLVQRYLPPGLPLELRLMGLVSPLTNASMLEAVVDLLKNTVKDIRDPSSRPNMELVQLYQDILELVRGVYSEPQTMNKSLGVRSLAHKNSQDVIAIIAAWLEDTTLPRSRSDGAAAAAYTGALTTGAAGGVSGQGGGRLPSADDAADHAHPVRRPSHSNQSGSKQRGLGQAGSDLGRSDPSGLNPSSSGEGALGSSHGDAASGGRPSAKPPVATVAMDSGGSDPSGSVEGPKPTGAATSAPSGRPAHRHTGQHAAFLTTIETLRSRWGADIAQVREASQRRPFNGHQPWPGKES